MNKLSLTCVSDRKSYNIHINRCFRQKQLQHPHKQVICQQKQYPSHGRVRVQQYFSYSMAVNYIVGVPGEKYRPAHFERKSNSQR
jgi:hypothetical protein